MLVKGYPGLRLIGGGHGVNRIIHVKMGSDIGIRPIGFINNAIQFNLALCLFDMELHALFVFLLSENLFDIKANKKESYKKQVLGSNHRSGYKNYLPLRVT